MSFLKCVRYLMTSITPIFYQSWDTPIPKSVYNETMKYIPKTFIYKRYSLKDIKEYLKTNWTDEIVKLFDEYKKIAHKIDLWRYCILYDTGGVYMDADCVLKNDITEIIKDNNCFFVTNNRNINDIFNGFLGTFPKNPIYKEIIDYMLKVGASLANKKYYYNCIELYTIVNKYIKINVYQYDYITDALGFKNGKICVLIDRDININDYVAFYKDTPILIECSQFYPYKINGYRLFLNV